MIAAFDTSGAPLLEDGRAGDEGGRSRPMRVCLVTETFSPQVNGVSRTLGQLDRYLRAAGERVLIVHPDYHEADLPSNHVAVRSVRVPFYRELKVPLPPFRGVMRRIDEFGPDVIHIATEATLGLSALRFAKRRGYPVVSSFHTNFDQYTHHYGLGWSRGLIWRYLRWFHNSTRQTYVPSRATIRDLEARGFERLVLWPRGVDATIFRPDRPGRTRVRESLGLGPDQILIGHVGRLAAEKSIGELTESLLLTMSAHPNARVLVVGDGPAREEMERALGDRAHFAGFRSGEDLADHYAAADLFAFTSRTETFGNVVLEALASGLPVVAVRAGGPGEIVRDGENGFLIDPEAPASEHAAALGRLIEDEGLRRRMSDAGRRHALEQSWDAIMAGIHERYGEVIAAAAARG